MDCRGTWQLDKNGENGKVDPTPLESSYFKRVDDSISLGKDDASDANSCATYDKDCVGLKGHINFYYEANDDSSNYRPEIDGRYGDGRKANDTWPFKVKGLTSDYAQYTRPSYILPYFYLSVRVMKIKKGKKAYIPKATIANKELDYAGYWDWMKSVKACAPFYDPKWDSKVTPLEVPEWEELTRFNIPIKVYCNRFDSERADIINYKRSKI